MIFLSTRVSLNWRFLVGSVVSSSLSIWRTENYSTHSRNFLISWSSWNTCQCLILSRKGGLYLTWITYEAFSSWGSLNALAWLAKDKLIEIPRNESNVEYYKTFFYDVPYLISIWSELWLLHLIDILDLMYNQLWITEHRNMTYLYFTCNLQSDN